MAQQQQRYKVIEKIASGGMAEVFRAESAGLEGFKKTVAIKRVLSHLSEKKQFIGMFLDEARLSAHLSHSNVVQVFDIGVGDNTYFIVMEYVDGADLKAIVEHCRSIGKTFPMEEAVLTCVRLCEGLAYAHELRDSKQQDLQIVHRDMSPPNVLLTRHGEVKIVDFGLAKANSQLEHSEPGIIKGKFSYLSPEAAQGMPIDARTDIFAVGIILWELLAGRRLFLGETDLETVRQVQAARVPPIRQFNPHVPPKLEAVLTKSLAGDPTRRYQTARDFGRDLNEVLFSFGRAVSSFDLAQLVSPIWETRTAEKQARQRVHGSLIGSLIDEALIEFTSLQPGGDGGSTPSQDGASPLNIGTFENAQDWAKDLGFDAQQPAPRIVERQFEVGNLAALEDEEVRSRRGAGSSRAPPTASSPPSRPANPSPPQAPPAPDHSDKRSKGSAVALFLVLLVAAGVVGAYFAGVIPSGVSPR